MDNVVAFTLTTFGIPTSNVTRCELFPPRQIFERRKRRVCISSALTRTFIRTVVCRFRAISSKFRDSAEPILATPLVLILK